MNPIPHQEFLEIGTSLQFLASLFQYYGANQDQAHKCLRGWKIKYDVNPLAGSNLAAIGWMIVVRWFELTKVENGEFPADLLNELHRRAVIGKFDMQTKDKIEGNYQCQIMTLDIDSRDGEIFLGSFIRQLRNAISHYDITNEKRSEQNIVLIRHAFHGKEKLHMEIDPLNYVKLIGDLGILYQESVVHLDSTLQTLIKPGHAITLWTNKWLNLTAPATILLAQLVIFDVVPQVLGESDDQKFIPQ